MNWFSRNKQTRQHLEREREALARSIEELAVSERLESDEEGEEASLASAHHALLIPPRLRLQSRPMPVVRVETAQQEARMLESDAPMTLPGKRLGHSTKVRLQAVRSGQAREPITERISVAEPVGQRADLPATSNGEQTPVLVRKIELPATTSPMSPPLALFCGSGVIEQGQTEATIHNPRIYAQSVVTVMLAGNPGPVVVHYVSLQPRAGFTLQMSAPVSFTTPFNYAVITVSSNGS